MIHATQKTFAFVLLSSLLIGFSPYAALAMDGLANTANATTPNATSITTFSAVDTSSILKAQCTKQRKAKVAPLCPIVIQDHGLPSSIKEALDKSYLNPIKGYFEPELDFVKKRKQLNQALMHVAQKPPHTRQDVVSFILKEINPNHLENVECLINTAAHNGHTRIIHFLSKHASPAEFLLPVLNAIMDNEVETLEVLLAGIDANYRPSQYLHNPFITHAVYYGRPECVRALVNRKLYVQETDNKGQSPISAACLVYKEHALANADDQDCRLAVVQELFKGVPADHVDKELAFQLKFMHKKLHKKVTQAVNYTLYPPQLSMEDVTQCQELKEASEQFHEKLATWTKRCIFMGVCVVSSCCMGQRRQI